MKIGIIVVLYKTPLSEVRRLRNELKNIHFKDAKLYFIDNTKIKKGFAYGVNKGIKKGQKEGCELFIVANADISLRGIIEKRFLEASRHFDIYGFAMKQNNRIYYGGALDKWRMSAILVTKKPKKRFIKRDYVTGSLMTIKGRVIDKIGLMDETYDMYYEDVDYCKRAIQAGFKVGVDSHTTYTHFEISQGNLKKKNFLFKNRLKFFLKYSNPIQKIYELLRLPKTTLEWFLLQ